MVAAGERNRIDTLYRTVDGGVNWERVPLAMPRGLSATADTSLDPVAGPGGGVLLVLSAWSRSRSERRPPDGRVWAAAGRDLFAAGDPAGPWSQRTVPLPAGQVITGLNPVGDGVLWLTTRGYPAIMAVTGGQLYRSADDGANWNRVTV